MGIGPAETERVHAGSADTVSAIFGPWNILGNNTDVSCFRLDVGVDLGDAIGGRNFSLLESKRDLDDTRYRTGSLAMPYTRLDLT